jgi:hypothetical protein
VINADNTTKYHANLVQLSEKRSIEEVDKF